MAGLISDTLNLTSPTATPTDRAVLDRLAKIAGIDGATLAARDFRGRLAAADARRPRTWSPPTARNTTEAGVRFSVAQIEELGFRPFDEKHEELAAALDAFCAGQRLFFSALLVTDINTQNSSCSSAARRSSAGRSTIRRPGTGLWQLDGVVSRKKQLLPYLLQRLQETRVAAA